MLSHMCSCSGDAIASPLILGEPEKRRGQPTHLNGSDKADYLYCTSTPGPPLPSGLGTPPRLAEQPGNSSREWAPRRGIPPWGGSPFSAPPAHHRYPSGDADSGSAGGDRTRP